jgi:hypothetical protein
MLRRMSRRSLLQALMDPEEMQILNPFLRSPLDPELRRAYATWLREHDDIRGELLEIAIALDTPDLPRDAAKLRVRMRKLAAKVDPFWVRVFSRAAWILNCGAQRDQPPQVRFATECPKLWEELTPTAEPGVRQCGACNEAVYECRTREEAEAHGAAGRCVAVPSTIADAVQRDVAGYATGRPHGPTLWAGRLFDPSRPRS